MQTPPLPHRSRFPAAPGRLTLLGAGALAMALSGCFDNDPGLQERLVRTQADLQEKTRKVQELETALEKARERSPAPADSPATTSSSASSAATPAMLTKEQLEETYVAAAKVMRQQVESDLSGYTVENCALFKVDMPSVALPYTSKVALNLRSTAGQPYRLEFPVGADWSGKWTFPATGDIAASLEKAQAQASSPARTPAAGAGSRGGAAPAGGSTAAARPSGRSSEGPASTSVETVEMTWGNSSRRTPGVAAPRQPAPEAPADAAGVLGYPGGKPRARAEPRHRTPGDAVGAGRADPVLRVAPVVHRQKSRWMATSGRHCGREAS